MFGDSTVHLDVPALILYHADYSEETLEMRKAEGFINWVETIENIEWHNEYSSL